MSGWLIEALIASTILMIFVLLVRKHAQRAIGPQLAYWLWALPVLRMAMPPLPASWRESAAAPISAASETVMILVEPILPAAAAPESVGLPWLAIVAAAWGIGAIGFFAWHGLAHFSFVRRVVAPPAQHERLSDGTTLVESDEAVGPVAFGVLRRFVAVPSDFAERYDADERKLALAHELGHHARGDLIANWIALAMLAVHWFNPIAWVAYRKFRSDQEMANDARVLSELPAIERHAYACAIVKAAHGRAVTAACHLHTIEDLKGRLRMLKASRKSRRVLMAGAVGIASLTVAGLGLTASGAAAEKIRAAAETEVEAITQTVSMTQAAAPEAPEAPGAATPPAAPGAPTMQTKKKIVIVRDGKTETYEGAEADAFIAANPGMAPPAPGREVRQYRFVIRDKDGKTRTYEGAEAEAYMKANPEMRPPTPPVPPMPPVPGMATAPAALGAPMVWTSNEGGKQVTRVLRTSRGGYAYADGEGMDVASGDCGPGNPREFVRREEKNGKKLMIICEKRIERFANDQARNAERTARIAVAQARYGQSSALYGLNAGRAAILNNRNLTDEQREQALAGIDKAREEIERDLAGGKDDKGEK